MDAERGKRRMARKVFTGWASFSLLCLAGVVFGDLSDFEVDGLRDLHSAVTTMSSLLIVGLLGLDATAAQIIPAWRKQQ